MRRKCHPLILTLLSLNAKSSFMVLVSITVLLRMSSIAVITDNFDREEQLKSKLFNYTCSTDRGKLKMY